MFPLFLWQITKIKMPDWPMHLAAAAAAAKADELNAKKREKCQYNGYIRVKTCTWWKIKMARSLHSAQKLLSHFQLGGSNMSHYLFFIDLSTCHFFSVSRFSFAFDCNSCTRWWLLSWWNSKQSNWGCLFTAKEQIKRAITYFHWSYYSLLCFESHDRKVLLLTMFSWFMSCFFSLALLSLFGLSLAANWRHHWNGALL